MEVAFVIVGALFVIGFLSSLFRSKDDKEDRANAEIDPNGGAGFSTYNPQ